MRRERSLPTFQSRYHGDSAANARQLQARVAYNLHFAGQTFDEQAELHQNGYRDYDPATGRRVERPDWSIR